MYSKLQYISQGKTAEEQLNNMMRILDNGGKWIQLRFKNAEQKTLLALGEQVKRKCESYQATFIINDNVELAAHLDADGVHLGLTDSGIKEARLLLGNKKIIGGTANTLQQVLQRIEEKCDYIGVGPYAFTATKEKLSPIIGLKGYREIMHTLKSLSCTIPVYAIGGIKAEDIRLIKQTGIYGIAVSGLLTEENIPKELITQLNKTLYEFA